MRELTIVVADLPADFSLGKFPISKKLLNSASITATDSNLFQLFGIANHPFAAVSALALGLPAQQGYWLRADPVTLQTGLSQVHLIGNAHLQLDDTEVTELVNELNQFLESDHLRLFAPQKTAWYLQSIADPEINTFPLAEVIGKAIYDYLPQGKKGNYWRTLLTEIQMLLHQSPVNQQRKNRGEPLISSVWLWGNGKLPEKTEVSRWQKVFAADVLMQGLAMLTNTSYLPAHDFNACFAAMQQPGEYLLSINFLADQFEMQWFAPLLKKLQARQLAKVILILDGKKYVIDSAKMRKWWQWGVK